MFFFIFYSIKMSMSTRISDLPGPSINEPPQQMQQVPHQMQMQQMQMQQMPNLPNEVLNELSNININGMDQSQTSPSNIHMNIKKKVRFTDETENDDFDNPNFLTFIKAQITEDNLLLLILLIVTTRTELDTYISVISPGYFSNNILLTVFKASIILIFYLLMKQYILPKIKL